MSFPLNPGTAVDAIGADLSGQKEQSYIDCVADTGEFSVQTITYDLTANINQAEFMLLTNAAGTTWAIWFDIDAAGTEPTGAVFTGADNAIEVDIAGADTAAQVAAKVETAIAAITDVSTDDTAADGTMIITQDLFGAVVTFLFFDADSTAYSGGGALAVANTTVGVASNTNSTHVTFNGAAGAFNCWMDVASVGVDPSAAGTALSATYIKQASAAVIATAIAAAIDADGAFEAESDGARVKITNAVDGTASDIAAGTSPYTVSVQAQGTDDLLSPGDSPESISNNPAVL